MILLSFAIEIKNLYRRYLPTLPPKEDDEAGTRTQDLFRVKET